jgi:hypothetical protein
VSAAATEVAVAKSAVAVKGQCDKQTALNLTREIKRSVEQSWRILQEAFERRAWAALGYDSWDSYCSKELGTGLVRLAKEVRRQAVAELTGGERPMSNRAVAAALGVDEGTVRADRRAGAEHSAPAPRVEAIDAEVVEEHQTVLEPAAIQPQRVVRGADGKNYVAPARDVPPPAPRKRRGRRTHQQLLEAMTTSLSAMATVADEITELDGSMTRDEAAKSACDLDQQIRALRRMKNLLKKYAEAADRADAAERGDVG